ncbi:MAG: thioredoxin domain-containing protein [Cyanobacteria bacterium P01_F01_bin.3]
MISTPKRENKTWQIWSAIVAILLAVFATVLLTRPAETTVSMTPLSGIMTLKTLAAKSMPYKVALNNQKPTLIEFYADWCTTCQSMSATVNSLHEQYSDQINFVMLDIDDPQWAEQVASFGASGVPQFTLLNSQHQSVNTWVGKVPKPIFREAFGPLMSAQAVGAENIDNQGIGNQKVGDQDIG